VATPVSPELTSLRTALRLAPARPALPAGLRTAVVATLPLVVAQVFGLPQATWVAVAGFLISLGDKGGAYRTRARTMLATTVAVLMSALIAVLTVRAPALVLPVTFLWITAAGLAHAYGDAVAGVGTVGAVVFCVSLFAAPPDLVGALSRLALLAVGGAWAMSLSLVLWPIRVYKPARRAVAAVYDEIAEYASEIASICRSGDAERWHELIQRRPARIRQQLEEARRVLAGIRRGGTGERARGERLLVVLESADRMFANLVAVADVMESVPGDGRDDELEEAAIADAVVDISTGCRALAGAVRTEDAAPDSTERSLETRPHADLRYAQVMRLIARLERYRATAADVVASMNDDTTPYDETRTALDEQSLPARMRPPRLAPLRANLSLDSLVLQHALRVL
jgi:uncharacterized membrane protein YccC